jgi:FkbM family methyltransferase
MMDVGANVGDYSAVAAAAVGPSGHVYAFEPGPDNLTHLRHRFQSVSHVSVIAAAVGDQSGAVTLFLDRRDGARHSLAASNIGKAGQVITVTQVVLDDYYDRVSRLDAVKIDAQGAELSIIRGAHRLLTKFRPPIVLELWPHGLQAFGASADLLLTALKEMGCAVHRLSAKGPLKSERFIDEFLRRRTSERWSSINIVAMWPGAASRR